ncbi:FAD-dependent monooxygenase [Nonomuraea sp. NPDC049709]|uniref:FAD-dependent monooxygenase n=1 Tax=Nonomuraea sp. NPDC049709 TaxID=3154736 RepID=UPI00344A7737
MLRGRLAELGGKVEHGTALTGFEQDERGVTARLGTGESVRARYLIAADGGRSRVRKALGIGFTGETREEERMALADVRVEGLDRDHIHAWVRPGKGMVALYPMAGTDTFQLLATPRPGIEPEPTLGWHQRTFAERSMTRGVRLTELLWSSFYRVNIRLADRYRSGRVFLAGDAVHVHPPAGGQGPHVRPPARPALHPPVPRPRPSHPGRPGGTHVSPGATVRRGTAHPHPPGRLRRHRHLLHRRAGRLPRHGLTHYARDLANPPHHEGRLGMGKLVRDRIPEIIRRTGEEPVITILGEPEYRAALMAKLFEEATEVSEAPPEEVAGELADVYEVLRALAAAHGHDWQEIERTAEAKREERGAFKDRLYLA